MLLTKSLITGIIIVTEGWRITTRTISARRNLNGQGYIFRMRRALESKAYRRTSCEVSSVLKMTLLKILGVIALFFTLKFLFPGVFEGIEQAFLAPLDSDFLQAGLIPSLR